MIRSVDNFENIKKDDINFIILFPICNKIILSSKNDILLLNYDNINDINNFNNITIKYFEVGSDYTTLKTLNKKHTNINLLYQIKYNQNIFKDDNFTKSKEFKYIFNKIYSFISTRFDKSIINIPDSLMLSCSQILVSCVKGVLEKNNWNNYIFIDIPQETYNFYRLKYIVFQDLSDSSLYVDKKALKTINHSLLNKKDKHIYDILKNYNKKFIKLKYNIFASDFGRVQVNWKGLNFINIQKDSPLKEVFKSRFKEDGEIIKIDLNGFHLRIIDNLIPPLLIPIDEDAHTYIASKLLKKPIENITTEERDEVKQINFTILYSPDIDINYIQDIDFFKKISDIKLNTQSYKTIYNRTLPDKYLDSMNRFNYFMQMYESDYVTWAIKEIQNFLNKNNFKSKVIFYEYDGIYLDILNSEKKSCFLNFNNIFNNRTKEKKQFAYKVTTLKHL